MRLLHVFAGPFPTYQGTQALVGQICRLLDKAGHDVHLLTYAHGAFESLGDGFTVHRIDDWPRFRSERSGPALERPVLDAALSRAARRLFRELEPDIVHAHHYEALTAVRLAGLRPLVFHLHALLGPELPQYLPGYLRKTAALTGGLADRVLPRLAERIVVVSEGIRDQLARSRIDLDCVRLIRPAAEPPDIDPPAKRAIGRRLRAIYLGNLDSYQGFDALFDGLRTLDWATRSTLRVEVVTASDPEPFLLDVRRTGIEDMVRVVPHGTLEQAWFRLLAADFVLVPRYSPGGVPIKLVNALAVGKPVLVDRRMAGELIHGEEAWIVDMRDPQAVAAALTRLSTDEILRLRLSEGAIAAAKRLHDPKLVTAALESLYAELVD
ncbi:MAG: glycosyltransferase [Deltaproteobacteria bacterium]|nr:glycosyltransferase [Deltaproteobacteria bacterium]